MYSANASAVAVSSERSLRPDDELARVCGEVAAICRRACGRGPAKTTAHWAGPNMLVVVLEDGHTDAEKTLRAAGHNQQLILGRQLLHGIIEDELKRSVERIIGRRVETVLSATRLDPDLSAEIFLLAGASSRMQTAGAERRFTARTEKAAARTEALRDEARALEAQNRQVPHQARRQPRVQ